MSDAEKSVARQVEHARAYVAQKGWSVAEAHVYVDDGISGAEFANRPGFVRLMNALRPQPAFQVLVMSEEARLGRESIETAYALKQLLTAGVRVFFYLEDRERTLDTPTDKMMLSLTAYGDEIEREKARLRTHDAMRRKAQAGQVTGGRVFGYDNVRRDTGGVVRHINDEEAQVVRRIFTLSADGRGLKPIARQLNAEGAPCPRPQRGRPAGWAPSSVREILHRPLYRGEVVWNRTQKRNAWGQTQPHARPESEWIRQEVPELRIVSEELWTAVQTRLGRMRAKYLRGTDGRLWGRPKSGIDSKYLLSGLARCGVCGGGLYVKSRSHGRRRAYFYGCTSYHQRGTSICPNGQELPMGHADRVVLSAILEDMLDPTLVEAVVVKALEGLKPLRDDAASRRQQLHTTLGELGSEVERLTTAIARGGELPSLLVALQERETRRAALRAEQDDLAALDRTTHIDPRLLEADIRARVQDWRGLLTRQTTHARRLLRTLLDGPMIFTPLQDDPRAWEFTAKGRLDRLLAGIVDATSVASPTGRELNFSLPSL
ncbi:MAG: recombinase family protein, partial [Gemmatimonadales bacterium]